MSSQDKYITEYVYHIYSRGVRKSQIYINAADYQRWEDLIYWCKTYDYPFSLFTQELDRGKKLGRTKSEVMEKYNHDHKYQTPPIEILAYVEMPNHFHMVLKQLRDRGISEYIHRLLTSYSKYLNIKHNFTGSVFESNAKSIVITTDEQLMQVMRYIHLNPLAAKLVTKQTLSQYKWSSWPEYIGTKDTGILNMKYLKHYFNTIARLREFTMSIYTENDQVKIQDTILDNDFNLPKQSSTPHIYTL